MSLLGRQPQLEGPGVPGMSVRPVRRRARRVSVSAWGVLLAVCLLLSLAIRLRGLDVFLTSDELRWTCRSINFRTALLRGDLARTFQVGHPGVMTMWAGTLGLPLSLSGDWSDVCPETQITQLAAAVGPERMGELGRMTFLARRAVAVLTWLCTIAIALLVARLFGPTAGLRAAGLAGFDPLFVALSRVLHVDALAGSFVIVSFLALLVALERSSDLPEASDLPESLELSRTSDLPESSKVSGRWTPGRWSRIDPYLVASGLAAGLGFLSKSPALFLGPVAVLLLFAHTWSTRRAGESPWRLLLPVLVWCVAAGAAMLVLWPALWVNPVGTVLGVLDKAAGYAAEGHDNFEYFMGRVSKDPGPLFYPVAWAYRTTPLVWLGLLGLVWGALVEVFPRSRRIAKSGGGGLLPNPPLPQRGREQSVRAMPVVLLVAFAILFALFMTAGAKKFDRYIVPTFLALDVVAAVGLARLVDGWRSRHGDEVTRFRVQLAAAALAAVLALALVLPFGPYLFSYYNPLLGGPTAAQHVLQVGWGEGLDQAAAYLNAQPDSRNLHAATRYVADFSPLFAGYTDELEGYDSATADFLVFYVNQVQRQLNAAVLERYVGVEQPALVVNLFGVDYAWVYANADNRPVAAYLVDNADPAGDAIVLNRPSRLQRDYTGPLPVHVVSPEWDMGRVSAALTEAARGRQRLWYVSYPRRHDDSDRTVQHWLDTRAWLAGTQKLPTISLAAYELLEPRDAPLPEATRSADTRFDGRLRLRGFGLDSLPAQFGRGLSVALDWEALRPPGEDLDVALRLVDADGHGWGEGGKPIGPLDRLTSDWTAGDTWLDRVALYVAPGTPPGEYEVKLSVTRNGGKARLTLGDSGAAECSLGTIAVAPSPAIPSLEQLGLKGEGDPTRLSVPAWDGAAAEVKLLGAKVPAAVRAGDKLPVTLIWEAAASPAGDLRLRIGLASGEAPAREIVSSTMAPTGDYPTSRWQPGARLRSQIDLAVPPDAPDGPAGLRVQFVGTAGEPVGEAVEVARVEVIGADRLASLPADLSGRPGARLGSRITLAGYNLQATGGEPGAELAPTGRTIVAPGGKLRLSLYWQASGAPDRDYKVFVHLVDPTGQIRAQVDVMPGRGKRPTSRWAQGDLIADEYELSLPAGSPAGVYRLYGGMYDPETLQRLPVLDAGGGRLAEDRIPLGEVEVKP